MARSRRRSSWSNSSRWPVYVPVHERRARASRAASEAAKTGQAYEPVQPAGKAIATSYWGKAWCHNLESYSDYSNRLPRGKTYLRNGSVVDLKLGAGVVRARVSGSRLYTIEVKVQPLPAPRWQSLVSECAGHVASIVDLLRGEFSDGVMRVLTRQETGLFPSPREITFACSCPDWASMCKHVAAVLYGVGTRFDSDPALFFTLRQVESCDLVTAAASATGLAVAEPEPALVEEDLGSLFGIALDGATAVPTAVEPEDDGFAEVFGPDLETSPSLLLGFGVPRSTYQKWLQTGVLERTSRRGLYRTTDRTLAEFRAVQAKQR